MAIVLLAGPAMIVAGTAAAHGSAPQPTTRLAPASGTFDYISAYWNSASNNVTAASTPRSAFLITPGQTAHINFTFKFSAGSIPLNTSAQLQLVYLGISLTTDKSAVVPSLLVPGGGSAEVNFSFDPLYDALEGAYLVEASLVDGSGGAYWTQSFYIFAKAPYFLESAAVIVLLILAVAESYWIASAIREARRGPPGGGSTSPTTSSGPSTGSSTGASAPSGSGSGSPSPPQDSGAPPGASPPAGGSS